MAQNRLRSSDAYDGVQLVAPDVYTVSAKPMPRGAFGLAWDRARELALGPPLPSRLQRFERLGILGAVALLGSDMIASSVYGPEEMILHLVDAGPGGVAFAFPLSVAIAALLAVL